MGFLQHSSTALRFGTAFLAISQHALANPVAEAEPEPVGFLAERQACSGTPCGFNGWLCCASGQTCNTNSQNQAECIGGALQLAPPPGGGNGYWQYFTSTWVVTNVQVQTYTSVYSSYVAQATPTVQAVPTAPACLQCNQVCCGAGEYCLIWEQSLCGNGITTNGIVPTPPVRPTSSGLVTATVPFESAIPTGTEVALPVEGGGGGLSPGAIAGIVIGVLAAILLLILICLFCCARALFDSILAIFGLGKKKRRSHVHEETYIEQHGQGAGGRRWYGANRPGRPEKKSKLGGIGGIAGILGALTLALGLKRRHDRKHDDKSSYTSSGYYSSDYTSSSKFQPPPD